MPPGRILETPDALHLAELHLVGKDLEDCLHKINALEEMFDDAMSGGQKRAVAEALHRDTITQLVDCFSRGRLSAQDVYGDVEGGIEDFEYFRNLRDTYAAHNIGPVQQCYMVILPTANGLALTDYRLHLSLPEKAKLPEYKRFIALAVLQTEALATPIHQRLLGTVAAMSDQEIADLKPLSVRTPLPEEFRLSRDKFRTGGKGRQTGKRGR